MSDIEAIKSFNRTVQQKKEEAAMARAELGFLEGELEKACAELSKDMNMEVNAANLEEVYRKHLEHVQSVMTNGSQIFERIEARKEQPQMADAPGQTFRDPTAVPTAPAVPMAPAVPTAPATMQWSTERRADTAPIPAIDLNGATNPFGNIPKLF